MLVQELQLKRQLGHSDKQGVCQEQESQALTRATQCTRERLQKKQSTEFAGFTQFFFYKNGARQGFVNPL